MTLKKLITGISLGFLILAQIPLQALASTTGFSDVNEDYIYYDAIMYVQAEGIVNGYPDGTYRPDNWINRAEFTKIIINSKYTEEEIAQCLTENRPVLGLDPFSDVPRGEWFAPYICMAKELGIIGGYPDGTFQPSRFINFAESAKIISLAYGFEVDTTLEPWYHGYVDELAERNAIPMTIESFDHYVTRGEMAEIIYRLLENITDQPSQTYESLGGESSEGDTGNETNEEEENEKADGPDLSINDIYLNSSGNYNFVIENVGNEDIESIGADSTNGDVFLYVNEEQKANYILAMEVIDAGTDFYEVGGSTTINSGINSSGEIKVCLNTEVLIENDADTSNDCRTESFAPDLTISDIMLAENGDVRFEISNIGNLDIESIGSDSIDGEAHLYVNGEVKENYILSMEVVDAGSDFYEAGGSTIINSDTGLSGGSEVKVCLESDELIEDDANPENDCKTVTFAADLSITDIFLEEDDEITFEISNVGNMNIEEINSDSSDGEVHVYVNGVLTEAFVMGMEMVDAGTDFYEVGGSTLVKSETAITTQSEVKVCVQSAELIEGDPNTENDCKIVTLP